MSSNFADISQYLFIVLGIYCVYRGVMILLTGKLTDKEAAGMRDYSEKGVRRYKLLNAGLNIFGGVLMIVAFALRIFRLIDMTAYRIIVLAAAALMIVVYFAVKNSCKKL